MFELPLETFEFIYCEVEDYIDIYHVRPLGKLYFHYNIFEAHNRLIKPRYPHASMLLESFPPLPPFSKKTRKRKKYDM